MNNMMNDKTYTIVSTIKIHNKVIVSTMKIHKKVNKSLVNDCNNINNSTKNVNNENTLAYDDENTLAYDDYDYDDYDYDDNYYHDDEKNNCDNCGNLILENLLTDGLCDMCYNRRRRRIKFFKKVMNINK